MTFTLLTIYLAPSLPSQASDCYEYGRVEAARSFQIHFHIFLSTCFISTVNSTRVKSASFLIAANLRFLDNWKDWMNYRRNLRTRLEF